jgi:hypothetical protein
LIQILGPVTTFSGVILSIWGTYLLTRWYHPFKLRGFLQFIFQVTGMFIVGRKVEAIHRTEVATKLGRVNREKRAVSLIGLYLIFVGFIFQGIGAFCWGVDTIWGFLVRSCPA